MSNRWRLVRAGGDAVPASVRRFSERARRRRWRAARPWLLGLGGLAVLAAGFGVVYATPVLGVGEVRVVGDPRLVTPAQVRTAAAVAPGTPLLRVRPAAIARRVGRLTAVERAIVTRRWPRTLVVRVVERTPVAAIPLAGRYEIVDRSGVVFDSAPRLPSGLPVLKLATPGGQDPTTRAALVVLDALSPPLRARMAALAADGPARIRLELHDGRQVVWGDATQNEAKVRVAERVLGGDAKIMDVSAPGVVTTR